MMKKCCAEMIGTFALVFAGTGAIVCERSESRNDHARRRWMTFGLVVLAMIYTVWRYFRRALNPAVTIGFWAARRLSGRDVLGLPCEPGCRCASGQRGFAIPFST